MERLKQFASQHTIQFAILVLLYYLNFSIIAGLVASLAEEPNLVLFLRTLVVLAGIGLLWILMKRFGWLEAAGFTRLGSWRIWLLAAALLAYDLLVHVFGFFGDMTVMIADPGYALILGIWYIVDGGFQEFIFRGVVLYAMIRVWGDTQRGIYRSVLLSALLFGCLHIFNLLLGKTPLMVGFHMLSTIMAGIYYAVLVLFSGNIWPVVMIRGILNALINIYAVNTPGFSETTGGWIFILLLQSQLVLVSLLLLRRLPLREVAPDVP